MQLFISYSSKDRATADFLAAQLRLMGAEVFIDYERLDGGKRFPDQLRDYILTCDALILLVSSHSVESKWVRAEVEWAHDNDKSIIPVVLENTEDFRTVFWYINSVERIDFTTLNTADNNIAPLRKLGRTLGLITSPTTTQNIIPVGTEIPVSKKPSSRRTITGVVIIILLLAVGFSGFLFLKQMNPLSNSLIEETEEATQPVESSTPTETVIMTIELTNVPIETPLVLTQTIEAQPLTEPEVASPEVNCPGQLVSRLQPQMHGIVLSNNTSPSNLRSGPDVNYPSLAQMSGNEQFIVLDGPYCGMDYTWYRIQYNDLEGWIAESGDYYFISPVQTDGFVPYNTIVNVPNNREAALRRGPSTEEPSIGFVGSGSSVQVIDLYGDGFWHFVQLEDGTTGWIAGSLLRSSYSPPQETDATSVENVNRSSGQLVYVRSGTNTSDEIVFYLQPDNELPVLGIDGQSGWLLLSLPGEQTGWVDPNLVVLRGDMSSIPLVEVPNE